MNRVNSRFCTHSYEKVSMVKFGCLVKQFFERTFPNLLNFKLISLNYTTMCWKAEVGVGYHCEVLTSHATCIHVPDWSVPALSDLLGDDALVVPTPLINNTGFQAFYLAERNLSGARQACNVHLLFSVENGQIFFFTFSEFVYQNAVE